MRGNFYILHVYETKQNTYEEYKLFKQNHLHSNWIIRFINIYSELVN